MMAGLEADRPAAVLVEIRLEEQDSILCLSIAGRMSDVIFTVNAEQCDRVLLL